MFPLTRDLVFVILQCLYDCNMQESAQKIEQESKLYFNIDRFNSMILNAKWEAAENYLRSFTSPEDNPYSVMIFWVIGKQKYLEALDEHNFLKAVTIIEKDLVPLRRAETTMNELRKLLPLNNFRENREYSNYGNTETMRNNVVVQLMNLLKTNPKTLQKLNFPHIESSRLKNLLAQSFKWQHCLCENAVENPIMTTLFVDHACEPPSPSSSHQQINLNLQLRNFARNAQNNGAGSSTPQRGATNLRDLFSHDWPL